MFDEKQVTDFHGDICLPLILINAGGRIKIYLILLFSSTFLVDFFGPRRGKIRKI